MAIAQAIDYISRLPRSITGFNIHLDGDSFAGVVDEGTLPKFTVKTDEFRAGTSAGPVEIDLGIEAQSMQFTVAEPSAALLTRFSTRCQLSFKGSQASEIGGIETPFVITQFGLLKEVDLGNVKGGDRNGKTVFVHTVDIITVSSALEELIHIDNINNIRRLGGEETNQSLSRRINLGLA